MFSSYYFPWPYFDLPPASLYLLLTSLGRFTGFYSEYEPNFFQRIARAVRTDYDFSRTDIVFNSLSRLLLLQKRAARLLLDADFSQPSVSIFFQTQMAAYFRPYKTKKTCTFIQTLFLNNPDAPLCLKRKLNFLSSFRSTGLRTRACAFNLQDPYPRSNSGKRTFAYFAATAK